MNEAWSWVGPMGALPTMSGTHGPTWLLPRIAFSLPGLFPPIKNLRKLAFDSEDICLLAFLEYKNIRKHQLALGIMLIG